MGLFRTVSKGVSSGFRINRWLGTDRIKASTQSVRKLAKAAVKTEQEEAIAGKSFEEVLRHYNMTEDDLKKRIDQGNKIILFCLGGSVLSFAYMIYQFSSQEIIAGIVCGMLTLLMLAYAFREHFNIFQMKQRRLGCTMKEWFANFCCNFCSRGK